MNGRRILLVVGILLGLVAGSLAFLLREGTPRSSEIRRSAPTDGPARQSASPVRLGVEGPQAPGNTSARSDRQLADGIWIRGRVQIPAGTPPEDRIEVAARILSLED